MKSIKCPKCKGGMIFNRIDRKFYCLACGHEITEEGVKKMTEGNSNNNELTSLKVYHCKECDFQSENRHSLATHVRYSHRVKTNGNMPAVKTNGNMPAWNDNWSEAVQVKWLEVYRDLSLKGH